MGLLVVWAIYARPQGLRVPAWVAYAAAAAFVGGGGALIAAACESKKLEAAFGLIALLGLLVPFLWVALGPGPQECSVYLPFISTAGAEWLCRGGFGIASLLGLLILVLFLRRALRPGGDNSGA